MLLLLPAFGLLAVLYAMRAGGSRGGLEVETAQAALVPGGASAGGAAILTASGYVVARRKAVVSAKIQGRLADLRVEEGDRVREGELIARLESSDYEAQVQRAQALLQRAEADLAENERLLRQANDLARQQIVSRDQVDVAESRVRVAQAAMAQARAEIGYAQAQMQNTRILAPFTGTVVKKMAEVGESVAPIPPGVNLSTSSGAIVALADLDTLEVEADVSESNVAKLGPEQPAEVTVEAFPDRRYRAVLRQIIPTADRTKATVQVKVTILERDPQLRPEMSAKVQFEEPKAAEADAPSGAGGHGALRRGGAPRRQAGGVRGGRRHARGCAASSPAASARDAWWSRAASWARRPWWRVLRRSLKDGDAVRIGGGKEYERRAATGPGRTHGGRSQRA